MEEEKYDVTDRERFAEALELKAKEGYITEVVAGVYHTECGGMLIPNNTTSPRIVRIRGFKQEHIEDIVNEFKGLGETPRGED
jgi:hypothetical protein